MKGLTALRAAHILANYFRQLSKHNNKAASKIFFLFCAVYTYRHLLTLSWH